MASVSPVLCWQYVEKWAAECPNRECLVFRDRRITWRDLSAQVDATAKALLEAGVRKGDRVALLAMGCPEFPITFMAAAKIGAIWLGLSPKYTRYELSNILNDAEPVVLIALREYDGYDLEPTLLGLMEDVPSLHTVLTMGPPIDGTESFQAFVDRARPDFDEMLLQCATEVGPDDDLLLMYTSGSTGRPKGVIHTHRSAMVSVENQNRHFGFRPKSRALMHFPINHVAADIELGLAAIQAGAALVMTDHFDPTGSLRLIERERVTFVGGVPAMYVMQFASEDFRQVDLSRVETFVWAGSPAPRPMVETLAKLASRTGAQLFTGYGSTESGGFVTYSSPDDDLDTLVKTAGCVEWPTELRIVGEDHRRLSLGESGEIALRGPTLMRAYWRNPGATREVMDDEGWFYTGDVAWLDERGNVHIIGRTTDMYKTGGENVHPREVEEVLEWHPAVVEAAVVGVPSATYHEVGMAFVVRKAGVRITEEDLRLHCRVSLANFKIPRRFEWCTSLPVLPNGKVDRVSLREQAVSMFPEED